MSNTAFLPVAATSHVEPGKYTATCTAVNPPELYRAFSRWYLRIDFAIRGDGSIVSKYLNLGAGKEPNAQLGPRSDYYKLWSLAVGRAPQKNEPMDPAKIIGVEFRVTVVPKQRHGGGEYSVVSELERLSDGGSLLNAQDSTLSAQALKRSSSSGAQVPPPEDLHLVCSPRESQGEHRTTHNVNTSERRGDHTVITMCKPCDSDVTEMCNPCDSDVIPPNFSDCPAEFAEAIRNSTFEYRGGRYFHRFSGREEDQKHAECMIELKIQAARSRQ